MNPQVFGTEHLIYIAASLLTAFAVCFLTKKYAKTGKAGDAVVKVSAGILFLIIFANRLALVFEYSNPFYMTAPAIDGTIFTAWVMAPIYIVVYALILLAVELFRHRKSKTADRV